MELSEYKEVLISLLSLITALLALIDKGRRERRPPKSLREPPEGPT